ncbi:MAG: hypothetical protein QXR28_05080 [Nitrososphaerota archaeon]
MKIAVAGGGVSGSFFASLVENTQDVTVFERQRENVFRAICAWGTSKHEMRRLAVRIGLNFDEYILHEGREMVVKLPDNEFSIKLKGLCTFDKKRFILDMHKRLKIKYKYFLDTSIVFVLKMLEILMDILLKKYLIVLKLDAFRYIGAHQILQAMFLNHVLLIFGILTIMTN